MSNVVLKVKFKGISSLEPMLLHSAAVQVSIVYFFSLAIKCEYGRLTEGKAFYCSVTQCCVTKVCDSMP